MEQKNNSGTIFRNNYKSKDTHPDWRGKVTIDGKEWEISLWSKNGEKAGEYFSAAFGEPYVKSEIQSAPEPKKEFKSKPISDEFDDDLPF
jgi:uncharacterized protein (DUF736 family)